MNKLEEILRNTLGEYAMQAARLTALLTEANARVVELEKEVEALKGGPCSKLPE